MDKQLEQFARHWVGAPFVERGRSRLGVDCWGIADAAARALGKTFPDYEYEIGEHADLIASEMFDHVEQVERPQPWDFVGLDTKGRGELNHIGVYLGGGKFLHAMRDARASVCRLSVQPWARMVVGYYRLKRSGEVAV